MYDSRDNCARDELRGRFTRFMEVTVRNAKKNYLVKLRRESMMISLGEIPDHFIAGEDPLPRLRENEFEFEEEKLTKAFSSLPLMRQRILAMLFIEELTPAEIAKRMNCSVQHVYNQRSLALKRLRQLLSEGGEDQ